MTDVVENIHECICCGIGPCDCGELEECAECVACNVAKEVGHAGKDEEG